MSSSSLIAILILSTLLCASNAVSTVIADENDAKPPAEPVIHDWTSPVMQGFPPTAENQVRWEQLFESQPKLRWGMQRLRELVPTHSVSRGATPVAELPRQHRDIRSRSYPDATGKQTTFGEQVKSLHMDAVIVLKDGTIVWEEYFHGMKPETPHLIFSMNKSLVATVVATFLPHGDGKLNPNATIETYMKELENTAYAGATVRQILDMESAVKYRYAGENSEVSQHDAAISPGAHEPGKPIGDCNFILQLQKAKNQVHGEGMIYKESDPGVLVLACERVANKRFADLVQERIWSKLGAEFDIDAQCDSLGHWTYNLAIRLRDVARWGQMCLNKGRFNGQQIVPAEFFDDIAENADVERLAYAPLTGDYFPKGIGYRSFFYHHQESGGAIAAAGAAGQFCYINPKHQVVIAFFSSVDPAFDGAGTEDFARHQREERERWNLCHRISRLLGER